MSLTLVTNSELEDQEIAQWNEMLERLLEIAGAHEEVNEGEVAVTFVDDAEIRRLNLEYRGIDRSTDVLSFPMLEPGDEEPEIYYEEDEGGDAGTLLGDIVISLPRAQEQAKEYGHSLEREIGFLFVHGFLHLIGYDHQDEAAEKEMFAKQETILREAGLRR